MAIASDAAPPACKGLQVATGRTPRTKHCFPRPSTRGRRLVSSEPARDQGPQHFKSNTGCCVEHPSPRVFFARGTQHHNARFHVSCPSWSQSKMSRFGFICSFKLRRPLEQHHMVAPRGSTRGNRQLTRTQKRLTNTLTTCSDATWKTINTWAHRKPKLLQRLRKGHMQANHVSKEDTMPIDVGGLEEAKIRRLAILTLHQSRVSPRRSSQESESCE